MNTNDICCLSMVLIWLSINFVRITCGEESLATEFPSVTSSLSSAISIENTSTIAVLNCTRCNVWKGDDCFKSEPCIFCNQSIQCIKESTVCKDNVCLDINWDSKILKLSQHVLAENLQNPSNAIKDKKIRSHWDKKAQSLEIMFLLLILFGIKRCFEKIVKSQTWMYLR